MVKPVVLLILDGLGLSADTNNNAVTAAKTPVLTTLNGGMPLTNSPCSLSASGEDAGLPPDTMGNSEVGHTTIGAGTVLYQSLLKISKAIDDGSFFANPVLKAAQTSDRLHLFALLGDAGVHSTSKHLYGCLELYKNVPNIFVHLFTDGRDTPPRSAVGFLRDIQAHLPPNAKIATLTGRFYAMDRDNRWERIQIAYDALTNGIGEFNSDPVAAVERSYTAGIYDEFIKPVVTALDSRVQQGDTVVFVNFRPDRARELTRAFADPSFTVFERKYLAPVFICMTQYDETMPNVTVAYPPEIPRETLGEVISLHGLRQLRIAETEKYAHVTYFFNGGIETVFDGEDRVLIPSPKEFATYDLVPQMSAYAVTDALTKRISEGQYDMIICNFANCDMVGHTGNFSAAVSAVETVDICVGKVLDTVRSVGGVALITADHGNSEKMFDDLSNSPHTAHTTNLVPFWIYNSDRELLTHGRLCDVAPTILELLGIAKPTSWAGVSLLKNNQNI
ncbi:MAG: 2,3-bisphosphoglycerate-independent phosphoglycerate mutase [Oscillospiraceae bacterium]|jgi:2,3-bisphosphoglycerate-independent phosphoglycerate mutase|nr:2,3-bisphosphoglycerate-independent phosphoglycerate mutase [Oscillospiraceae bacterium]